VTFEVDLAAPQDCLGRVGRPSPRLGVRRAWRRHRRRSRVTGPHTPVDFLAIIEWRRAEGTNGYGMLYELSGMTGEPGIADL
jgi:hypothetical protein